MFSWFVFIFCHLFFPIGGTCLKSCSSWKKKKQKKSKGLSSFESSLPFFERLLLIVCREGDVQQDYRLARFSHYGNYYFYRSSRYQQRRWAFTLNDRKKFSEKTSRNAFSSIQQDYHRSNIIEIIWINDFRKLWHAHWKNALRVQWK